MKPKRIYFSLWTLLLPMMLSAMKPTVEVGRGVLGNFAANASEERASEPESRLPLALKTNLLFDLATLLNVELEYRFAPRWAVLAEGNFSWWNINRYQYSLHTNYGLAELRYYLGSGRSQGAAVGRSASTPPRGWFVGVHAGAGRFGLTYPSEGYMGNLVVTAGFDAGFTHPLSRHLSMEYCLGLGYVMSNYDYFLVKDDGSRLVWQHSGRYQGILPTRAKVSLVWWLPFGSKRKGGRP